MISIANLIESLTGKQFEIDCSEIAVHGILDHHPPLYKGPGVIIGGKKGTIAFRLHNQVETTEEALRSLRPIEEGGLGEPVNQVRVFAKDYRGIDWTGGWAIPGIEHSLTPHFMVNGEFDLLSTRILKSEGDKKQNVTEIVFGEKLNLPMTEVIEERSLSRLECSKELCAEFFSLCLIQLQSLGHSLGEKQLRKISGRFKVYRMDCFKLKKNYPMVRSLLVSL
jgi:hypothetical protein